MKANKMNGWLTSVVCGGALLWAIRASAQDRVLAAGNPPLTQTMFNGAAHFRQWLLDIEFSEAGWQEYQRRLVAEWEANPSMRSEVKGEAQTWTRLRNQPQAELESYRATEQPKFLAELKSGHAFESEKLLLAVYEDTNKELVTGEEPLTQGTWWKMTSLLEWYLGARLTDAQLEQHQKYAIADWRVMDKTARATTRRELDAGRTAIYRLNPQQSRWWRAKLLPGFLKDMRQGGEEGQWFRALYLSRQRWRSIGETPFPRCRESKRWSEQRHWTSASKISSMWSLNSRANLKASGRLGSYRSVSMAFTVWRETPSFSAKSDCDHSLLVRRERRRFFIGIDG